MWKLSYSAHEALVGPARARAALWRLLAGLILIFVLAFFSGGVLGQLVLVLWPSGLAPDGPGAVLVLLFGFGLLTLATWIVLRLLHDRGFLSLLGAPMAVLRDFWTVSKGLALLLAVLWLLPPYDMGAPIEPNLAPGVWLMLLPFSLTAILVQTSAEEIVFRGYMQQQLAARFRSPLVWALVPSAVFAVGHYLPAEAGDNAVYIALWAGVFGILMADLTARAGNLGPAIAVHFANNVSSLLIVSLPDGLSGLSLYTIGLDIASEDAVLSILPIDFAGMILMWLTARIAIRA